MKAFLRGQPTVTTLIYGFSRTAQFTLTAGNPAAICTRDRDFLKDRAADIATLVRAVGNIASSGFRLGGGDALLLGIPTAEPEHLSGRQGLCIVYAVHISRHRRASATLLADMLSILNTYIAQALSGTPSTPDGVATEYTRLLQEQADSEAAAFVSEIPEKISQLFTNILDIPRYRRRTSPTQRFLGFNGVAPGSALSDPYAAVCIQAVRHIRASRRVQFCYYLPHSPKIFDNMRILAVHPSLRPRINTYCLLAGGIVIGHSFQRRLSLPMELHGPGSAPGLVRGGPPPGLMPPPSRTSRRRLAAAIFLVLAAALAITLFVLSIASGPQAAGKRVNGGHGASGALLPSPDSVPPYYVAIDALGNPRLVPSYAVVRATATGAQLGMIRPSLPEGTVLSATAAANDQTFVLDEEKFQGNGSRINGATETRAFYLLRLHRDGTPASVTQLPMTIAGLVTGMALSPDGSKLAIAVQPQHKSVVDLEELRIYTLATGAVRTWRGEGVIGFSQDDPQSLSWTANGKRLLFDWKPASLRPSPGSGVGPWLLDTALAGTELQADSHQVTSFGRISSGHSPSCQSNYIITPDGSAVVCGAVTTIGPTAENNTISFAFYEYSTSTGSVLRTLYPRSIPNATSQINVLWSNASGTTLIAVIPRNGDDEVGIIKSSTFTPLDIPRLQNALFAGAW